MNTRIVVCVLSLLALPTAAQAQRDLYWDRIDVDATLAADGTLRVTEMQTIVFTGDWNGGERRFNIRPRQRFALIEIARANGAGWQPLIEDVDIDDKDDYGWVDNETLRWRSRDTIDPVFANTSIRYMLRYELANILLKDGDDYVLDHDFLFPDREGIVTNFELRLTLDRVWQPKAEFHAVHTANRVRPGEGFVLTLPLRYAGEGTPLVWDRSRTPELVVTVWSLLGASGLLICWLFAREQANGRFARLNTSVDEAWLRENVLRHRAEVVGAAWDESIDAPEVVALIARMVSEGKLVSEIKKDGSLGLQLKVNRDALSGHERTLVEGLFFAGRTSTSTGAVKQHYRSKGFDPARAIAKELEAEVERMMPPGRTPLRPRGLGVVLFVLGFALLLLDDFAGNAASARPLIVGTATVVLIVMGWAFGTTFRSNLASGPKAALIAFIPALAATVAVSWYLYFYVGTAAVEGSTQLSVSMALLALAVTVTTFNAMRSRRHRAGMALKKSLTAGREFFSTELSKDRPALRDEWYPWIVAFGLGPRADDWSVRHGTSRTRTSGTDRASEPTSTSSSSRPEWTGFAGGKSGGAGGGASWTAAARGLAAGVAVPSASGSGGGGGRSSGSSSSGGSSGGGGGGGW